MMQRECKTMLNLSATRKQDKILQLGLKDLYSSLKSNLRPHETAPPSRWGTRSGFFTSLHHTAATSTNAAGDELFFQRLRFTAALGRSHTSLHFSSLHLLSVSSGSRTPLHKAAATLCLRFSSACSGFSMGQKTAGTSRGHWDT
ncbi:hypothetical protein F2Q69_00025379 [Brassica cretica]|uniref:Uncharacterized protein n=1 Tax=Brassica cretica TaxID=69181 RepID=A0A8S9Q706_BRACR|nr:hypothetical protein F2Q69_00025379 [Brassica cretica]